jgi:hypothetical protein
MGEAAEGEGQSATARPQRFQLAWKKRGATVRMDRSINTIVLDLFA